MTQGAEEQRLSDLLLRRGTSVRGDAAIEREILERYQDDCSVLILDSSGFTRLTREHGIIYFLALVYDMRERVRPLCERHEAIAQWAEADNFYAVFPTAGAAVRCALAIHHELRSANAARPSSDRLDVCIGIGSGRLLRIGTENVYGDEMNLASKLGEDLAQPGEILMTGATHERLKSELAGLAAEPLQTRVSGVEVHYHRIAAQETARWRPDRG